MMLKTCNFIRRYFGICCGGWLGVTILQWEYNVCSTSNPWNIVCNVSVVKFRSIKIKFLGTRVFARSKYNVTQKLSTYYILFRLTYYKNNQDVPYYGIYCKLYTCVHIGHITKLNKTIFLTSWFKLLSRGENVR